MEWIGPGKVPHGGTYSANPLATSAALVTLNELDDDRIWNKLQERGKKLFDGVKKVLENAKEHFIIQGFPTVFWFTKTDKERVYNYRDFLASDFKYMEKLSLEMIKRGIMKDMVCTEPSMIMCLQHSEKDIERTIEALEDSIKAMEK